jgi:hypothetical protein
MNRKLIALLIAFLPLFVSCQLNKKNNYLYLCSDTLNDRYGYLNSDGDTIIKMGKYPICFTDTFKTTAIVLYPGRGFVAMDRNEKILFDIFPIDNGPDPVSDGLYRIMINKQIGFADKNGNIIIHPQFGCAFPFEDGKARVSDTCKTVKDGEHSIWVSDTWYFIDKNGKRLK